MYEVEIKAAVTEEKALRSLLKSRFHFKGTEEKQDAYFENRLVYNDYIRLRSDGKTETVTAKVRSQEQGVSLNRELEFTVSNREEFLAFIKLMGFKEAYRKVKRVELFIDGDLHYELVFIEPLGWFIEIEILTEQEGLLQQTSVRVKKALLDLGFSEAQIEPLSYRQLLFNKKVITDGNKD